MPWRNLVIALLTVASLIGAWQHWRVRPVTVTTPGMLAPADPVQTELAGGASPSKWGDFQVTPRAGYKVRARLLGREEYSRGPEGKLAPLDFLLGWGPMSDSSILSQIHLSQGARYYRWATDGMPPLPPLVINDHAANTHLIPANSRVLDTLNGMRVGQVNELSGYLVDVTRADGWHWKSSLTRTDSGAGACELMYVESAKIIS